MGKTPCCEKNGLKKGPWTAEEDQKLIDCVQKHGCGKWRTIPKNAGLERCGKSCRLRWTNYLRPDIKRGRFSFEEEETIIQLHCILGNKWSAIAARLPGRTDNEIKNYWNTHIRKRLLRMGIDPVTHSPRLDLLELSSILNSSSRLNFPSLLGIQFQPMLNPDLLNSGTALLSCQRQNPDFTRENLKRNQLINCIPQVQSQFQSFQENQLQNQTQEIQACTKASDSIPPFLDEKHLMQANLHHFSPTPSNCVNSIPNLWQNNGEPSNMMERSVPSWNFDYNINSDQYSVINSLRKNQTSQSNKINNIQNSSSPAYVNGSTEDERDSHCSKMLMFPSRLGVDGLM